MQILPFINDTEDNIQNIVRRVSEVEARFILVYGMGVTLRQNQRAYYKKLIELFSSEKLPGKYIKTYGDRYSIKAYDNANIIFNIVK
jgi:DNA repair photolyase